ncbi:MAG: hypothetical protein JW812_00875 [Alphaproteobacteria bacterium]|nr:hypothetical protein [Alphaproteobacteria bacterium]MBN2779783.1 hypothetical protein [Alphaproteobacteria bacterium]
MSQEITKLKETVAEMVKNRVTVEAVRCLIEGLEAAGIDIENERNDWEGALESWAKKEKMPGEESKEIGDVTLLMHYNALIERMNK